MNRAQEWRAQVPFTLEGIDEFCTQFRSWHGTVCGSLDLFAGELLLREALVNSVSYGSKPLLCVVRSGVKRLVIAIRDGGQGFDWRAALLNVEAENCKEHGRGLPIFRRYAHRVRFTESGNGVTLVRYFKTDVERRDS